MKTTFLSWHEMKKPILYFMLMLTMASCAAKKADVKHISLSPTVINSELATNFPRELKIDELFFYTPTMLNSGNVISIYDISTGDEIARTVRIGKGPQEFITPQIVQIFNGNIFIRDVNGKQQALFPVEQALYFCL